MFLVDKNRHPRDSRVSFDEPTHTYSIDGSSVGICSVTTLIHRHFPHFNPDEVIHKMRNSRNGIPERYAKMTNEQIKEQWDESGKEASGKGTMLHKRIELFYNNELDKLEIDNDPIAKEYSYFLAFNETIKDRLEPYRTEWSIFRKEINLAGQLDMLYKIKNVDGSDTGTFALYDWKRSKEIKFENSFEKGLGVLSHLDHCNFVHYSIQLNIYKRLLETLYDISVREMCLVILHPDNESFKLFPVVEMKREINLIFKERKREILKKDE